MLVQTVEELEREANDRVVLLEGKLQRSTNTIKVNKCTYLHIRQESIPGLNPVGCVPPACADRNSFNGHQMSPLGWEGRLHSEV